MRRQDLLDLKKEALEKRLKYMKVCSNLFCLHNLSTPRIGMCDADCLTVTQYSTVLIEYYSLGNIDRITY